MACEEYLRGEIFIVHSWHACSLTIPFCLYKHTTVSNELFKGYFSKMYDSIVIRCYDFVSAGNLNCWPTKSDAIQCICDLYGLTNFVTQSTCFKGENPTLINVNLVSNPRFYIGTLKANFGPSDHHVTIGAHISFYVWDKRQFHCIKWKW